MKAVVADLQERLARARPIIGDCRLILGDCRDVLPKLSAESVHCCVTSPPYFGLRDYGVAGQVGLEPMVRFHRGRVLKPKVTAAT